MGPKNASKRGREESSSQSRISKKPKQSGRSNIPQKQDNPSINSPKLGDSVISTAADVTKSSGDLASTHDITRINIMSSAKIQKQTTRTLDLLSEYPAIPPAKPKLVLLHAKAKVASKLITIVEIAKREIAASGGKWYQYNRVEELMAEQKPSPKGENVQDKKNDDAEEDSESDAEDAAAFETMKTPFERSIEGKPKVRAVPHMTIYLSRVRIDSLRKELGEQSNAVT